ncbi:MAG: nickel pincer cofactor biosynthesis protein LarC [Planctomycetota bacterium]|jgi:uncharacterized protein (TIGR00299 family) protein
MARVAWLDCMSGVAGDMLLGALLECGLELDALRADLATLGLQGLAVEAEQVRRGALAGTLVRVTVDGTPADDHRAPQNTPGGMCAIIAAAEALPAPVRERAQAVIRRLGEAEGRVHATDHVHFHEVGAWDTIADTVGVCAGLHRLGIERLCVSPVPTGRGTVQTAHGPMPIPAPATLELLQGIPIADPPVDAELTTPTGAALVAVLGDTFGPRPPMTVERIGYGAGTRSPAGTANVLRLAVGTADGAVADGLLADAIVVLETTLDDLTPERCGYLAEACRGAGALDVTLTPTQMKKGRPGIVLQVLAREATAARIESVIFRESSTFGVRSWRADRHILDREIVEVPTPYGPIRVKLGKRTDGTILRRAPEYDDVAAAARAHDVPFQTVYDEALRALSA